MVLLKMFLLSFLSPSILLKEEPFFPIQHLNVNSSHKSVSLFLIKICISLNMKSKTLIVYESQILFEILDEIKEYLNLEIINSVEKDFKNINFENFDNYVIVSTKEHKNIENYLLIDGSPKKILDILEKINIGLLKNKYLDQSELKIGKYKLDINSRKISFKDTVLSLTEKETELIIYINQKMLI